MRFLKPVLFCLCLGVAAAGVVRQDFTPAPEWAYTELVEKEAQSLFKEGPYFESLDMARYDDKAFAERLGVEAPPGLVKQARKPYREAVEPLLQSAEIIMQELMFNLEQEPEKWLYAQLDSRPRPIRHQAAGQWSRWSTFDYKGWHGYYQFDSAQWPALESLITEIQALQQLEEIAVLEVSQ